MNMNSYNCCRPNRLEFQKISSLSSLLELIGGESRLKLLCTLRRGEHCVCELMKYVDLSQSLISHHLKDLKDAGIVIDEKRGLRVYYSLTDKGRYITNLLFQIPEKGVKV